MKLILWSIILVIGLGLYGCEKPLKSVTWKMELRKEMDSNPMHTIRKDKFVTFCVWEETEHYYRLGFASQDWWLPKNPSKRTYQGLNDEGFKIYYSLWEDGDRVKKGKIVSDRIELDLSLKKHYKIINAPLHSSMIIDDEEMYRMMSDYNRNKYPEYIENFTER